LGVPKFKEENDSEVQMLLKEWQLCQDNLQRHNWWAWFVGSIMIFLSFSAMFYSTQITSMADRLIYSILLCIVSLGIAVIWAVFFFARARFFIKITRKRLHKIEEKLMERFDVDPEKEPLLHTKIEQMDKYAIIKGWHGVIFLLILLIFAWIFILIVNFRILIS